MRTCAYLNSLLDMFFSPGFSSYFPCSILNLSWWSYCLFCWENNSAQWRSWSSAQPSHLLCPGGLCLPGTGNLSGPCSCRQSAPTAGPNFTPAQGTSLQLHALSPWSDVPSPETFDHHSNKNSNKNTFLTTNPLLYHLLYKHSSKSCLNDGFPSFLSSILPWTSARLVCICSLKIFVFPSSQPCTPPQAACVQAFGPQHPCAQRWGLLGALLSLACSLADTFLLAFLLLPWLPLLGLLSHYLLFKSLHVVFPRAQASGLFFSPWTLTPVGSRLVHGFTYQMWTPSVLWCHHAEPASSPLQVPRRRKCSLLYTFQCLPSNPEYKTLSLWPMCSHLCALSIVHAAPATLALLLLSQDVSCLHFT